MNKREVGGRQEEAAAAYLANLGYRLVERNYRCARGEIDLICRHGRYLVFVEVKYRADEGKGSPFEAVDSRKQGRIRPTAEYYLYSHGLPEDTPCRFDVVGILGENVEVMENAF